ncbi:MAG: oxidoreductase, partial [Armatimonadetes bacterium CG_4_9_14_3_um_filter_66_14]
MNRRKFLNTTAKASAAFAGLTVVPSRVLGANGQTPPSEQITHAVIGVGGMGQGHLGYVKGDPTARLLAVCDVDANHLAQAVQIGGEGVTGYKDFREVLDRGDIDVVHVPT